MGNVAKGEVSVLQVGSQVVYGVHGVCNITGTEFRVIDRKKVEYLVLEPNDQPRTATADLLSPVAFSNPCAIGIDAPIQRVVSIADVGGSAASV